MARRCSPILTALINCCPRDRRSVSVWLWRTSWSSGEEEIEEEQLGPGLVLFETEQ